MSAIHAGMLRPPPDPSQCPNTHDPWTLALSLFLCIAAVVSYLPQHLRIIWAGTSEGFSPWYLLLGATSGSAGVLNILIVQWQLFRCCRVLNAGACLESLLGFFQVTLIWLLFIIILVLFLMYFPAHLKTQGVTPLVPSTGYGAMSGTAGQTGDTAGADTASARLGRLDRKPLPERTTTTPEWRLAVTLSIVVAVHFGLLLLLTLALLFTLPPTTPPHPLLTYLATFLGVSGIVLTVLQFAPQIHMTYSSGLVGALSLGTMFLQIPGTVVFVLSLALRPGTDWTTWLPFAVAGGMQAALLVICLCWKRRQRRLGIDDFGNPLLVQINGEPDERRGLLGSPSADSHS